MRSAALLQVAIETSEENANATAHILERQFDTPSVVLHDLERDRILVSVYLSATRFRTSTVRRELRRSFGPGPQFRKIRIHRLRPQDWSQSWKRHFKPIAIAKRLLIRPGWSRRKPVKGARVVTLNPGLSFGTGQHPTTQFCLQQLAGARRDGASQSFLDLGTGTGILAIAAAKLGYAPVSAFDFDADAIRIARKNVRQNRVSGINLGHRDLTRLPRGSRTKYDVICANLTYDLLIAERERIVGRLKPEGRLILAGILDRQFAQVRAAYQDRGMKCTRSRTLKEWTSGVFRFDAG